MKTAQLILHPNQSWKEVQNKLSGAIPQVGIVFGSSKAFKDGKGLKELKNLYPETKWLGASSAGEICDTTVYDETLIATLVYFEKTKIEFAETTLESAEKSYEAGINLVKSFAAEDLRHLFILSEGLNVNGSELVRGIRAALPQNVSATGGLSGDGADFKETYVLSVDGTAHSKKVTAIGFYGSDLKVGYGSLGGWDSFGVERLVTKSKNNILFELDGKPALELYKSFLGEHAANLPSSGLLFPLNMRLGKDTIPLVRTILAVNEEEQSLTFAGDIPEGAYVRLMKANFDRLIDGAVGAAKSTLLDGELSNPELAILISCVGRKLVLKQMVEEEVEGVKDVLGEGSVFCGFYSYGEISPFSIGAACELHNQTMTITTLKE